MALLPHLSVYHIVLCINIVHFYTALPTRLAIGPTDYLSNSEILITEVGPGGPVAPALACFTCNPSTAEWYFPDGSVITLDTNAGDITSYRQSSAITLHRRNDATSPTGLYCCGSPALPLDQRLCITLCKYYNLSFFLTGLFKRCIF